MKPHALLISNKHPLPSDDGKKAVLAGFVAYLVDRFGSENVTYVVVGRPEAQPPSLACATVWIAPPGRWSQARNVLLSLLGLSPLSLQEAVTRSRATQRALAALVGELDPALVLLDTVRIGQYFESPASTRGQRVLYMDDLFHLRFRRMLRLARTDRTARIAPAGTFAPMLPRAARSLLQFGPLRDLLYRIEMRKIERREVAAPAMFDACLLINPNEAQTLRERSGHAGALAIKPLLFPEPPALERDYRGAPTFVLFGSLRHPPYRASVLRFLQRLRAEVISAMPEVRIEIVGDGADDEVRALGLALAPHVALRGFVDDIAPLFTSACALLVPSVIGGGLRLKALTAMHYGLPIISTAAGIEGLPLVDQISFLGADSVEHFVEPMHQLRDPTRNREISRQASQVFERHFSRVGVFAEYDALFGVEQAPDTGHLRGDAV